MQNRRKLLWTLAWAVVSVLLFFCFRNIQWARVWTELAGLDIAWLAPAIIMNLSILGLWALQWEVFLPRSYSVPLSRMTEIAALISMTLNTVPFFAGHLLGVMLLWKRQRVGTAAALSLLALDQLAEGLAKVSVFLLLGLFTPIPLWMKKGILLVTIAVASLFVLLYMLARRYRLAPGKGEKAPGPPLGRAMGFVAQWANYLEALRSTRQFCVGLGLAMAMKGSEAIAIWAVQKAFGISLPLWTVFLVLAALALATMVPISPGNLGVYEAVVFFIYKYLGIPPEQAMGLALIQHLCYLLPMVGTGYLCIILRYFYPAERPKPSPYTPGSGSE